MQIGGDKKFYVNKVHRASIIVLRGGWRKGGARFRVSCTRSIHFIAQSFNNSEPLNVTHASLFNVSSSKTIQRFITVQQAKEIPCVL